MFDRVHFFGFHEKNGINAALSESMYPTITTMERLDREGAIVRAQISAAKHERAAQSCQDLVKGLNRSLLPVLVIGRRGVGKSAI